MAEPVNIPQDAVRHDRALWEALGYEVDDQGRPELHLPAVVQTWLPGNPVIPAKRWDWDLGQWVAITEEG